MAGREKMLDGAGVGPAVVHAGHLADGIHDDDGDEDEDGQQRGAADPVDLVDPSSLPNLVGLPGCVHGVVMPFVDGAGCAG